MKGGTIKTLADLLTIYRIAAAPVAATLAVIGYRDAFFILIIISLITDLVDGPLARWSGENTETGAKLDTIADGCTLLAGVLGLYLFEITNLRPELPWLGLFLVSYCIAALACLARFRTLPAYHLYLSKAAALCSGLFFVWLYVAGYSQQFLVALVGIGLLANLESLAVTLRLKHFRSDVRSVFLLPAENR